MKKAIFFDAGCTLINLFEASKPNLLQYHCERFSSFRFSNMDWKKGQLEAEKHLQRSVEDKDYIFSNTFWIDNYTEGLYASGMERMKASQIAEEVITKGRKEKRTLTLDPDCIETLTQLKNMNFKLAVVSNWDGTLEAVLKDLGIMHYFDYIADSHIEGSEKPDKEIFQITLEKMKLNPEEVIHVGDLYYTDIVGANNAGIDAILLDHLGGLDTMFNCKRITRLKEIIDIVMIDKF